MTSEGPKDGAQDRQLPLVPGWAHPKDHGGSATRTSGTDAGSAGGAGEEAAGGEAASEEEEYLEEKTSEFRVPTVDGAIEGGVLSALGSEDEEESSDGADAAGGDEDVEGAEATSAERASDEAMLDEDAASAAGVFDDEESGDGDELDDDEEPGEGEEGATHTWDFTDASKYRGGREAIARPQRERVSGKSPRQSMMLGAVLGAAIGDAMGHPTEFISSVDAIRKKYGHEGVTGFVLHWERDGQRFAPYTDDTQMAEVVLRALLESRDHDEDLEAAMKRMAQGFIAWADHPQGGHRAPGNACLSGCRALKSGAHWSQAGGAQAGGCGSVMRAFPFGLVLSEDLRRAEQWAAAHSKLTHRDPIALAASAAMAAGMARVIRGESPTLVLSEMVAAACRYCPKTAAMIATAIDEAQRGVGPDETLKRLQGWAAHEAIAAAAYIFARHPDDPVAAILEGTNTPGDSDSLATLAGALVGGRCGVAALPEVWVAEVERSEELQRLARRV